MHYRFKVLTLNIYFTAIFLGVMGLQSVAVADSVKAPSVVEAMLAEDDTKHVALYYTAAWCGACQVRLPAWKAFFEKHQDNGFKLVVVEGGTGGDACDGIDFSPSLFMCDRSDKLDDALGIESYPTILLWSRDGKYQGEKVDIDDMTELYEPANTKVEVSYGDFPQECNDELNPGKATIGVEVLIQARHRKVNGERNWASDMSAFIGKSAKIIKVGGTDNEGCTVVRLDVDDADWAWRLRDLKYVNAASLPPKANPQEEVVKVDFSVGDRVRVNTKTMSSDHPFYCDKCSMEQFHGQLATITKIEERGDGVNFIELDVDEKRHWWPEEWLEPILPSSADIQVSDATQAARNCGHELPLKSDVYATYQIGSKVKVLDRLELPVPDAKGSYAMVVAHSGIDAKGCLVVRLSLDAGKHLWRVADLASGELIDKAEELGMDMLVDDKDFIAMMEEITARAGKWAEGIVHNEKEPQGFAATYMVTEDYVEGGRVLARRGDLVQGVEWDNDGMPGFYMLYTQADVEPRQWYLPVGILTQLSDSKSIDAETLEALSRAYAKYRNEKDSI